MSEKLISAEDILKYTVLAGEIRNPHMEVVPAYFLREAPAVDAVEVVRCEKCVYNPQFATMKKGMAWCRIFQSNVKENGFCNYGERREENAVD